MIIIEKFVNCEKYIDNIPEKWGHKKHKTVHYFPGDFEKQKTKTFSEFYRRKVTDVTVCCVTINFGEVLDFWCMYPVLLAAVGRRRVPFWTFGHWGRFSVFQVNQSSTRADFLNLLVAEVTTDDDLRFESVGHVKCHLWLGTKLGYQHSYHVFGYIIRVSYVVRRFESPY